MRIQFKDVRLGETFYGLESKRRYYKALVNGVVTAIMSDDWDKFGGQVTYQPFDVYVEVNRKIELQNINPGERFTIDGTHVFTKTHEESIGNKTRNCIDPNGYFVWRDNTLLVERVS